VDHRNLAALFGGIPNGEDAVERRDLCAEGFRGRQNGAGATREPGHAGEIATG